MDFMEWALDVAVHHPALSRAIVSPSEEWLDVLLEDGRTFRFRPGALVDPNAPEAEREERLKRLIEIGARMGGDLIGSHLVPLTTGFDYLGDVIRCALGREPEAHRGIRSRTPVSPAAAVRFVFSPEDLRALETLKRAHPEYLLAEETRPLSGERVTDSSSRFGYFLMAGPSRDALAPLMPLQGGE